MKKYISYNSLISGRRLQRSRGFAWLACLAMLLCCSCSWIQDTAEDIAEPEPADAYLTVALDTGSADDASRDDASSLEHGDETEYGIKYAIMLLFKGNDLANATFCAGAPMVNFSPIGTQTDHISARYKAKFYLQEFAKDDDVTYWAIVIANPNGFMSVTKDSFSYTHGTSSLTTTTIKASDGVEYSTFIEYAFDLPYAMHPQGVFAKDGYVTMTNSLLYDKLPTETNPELQPLAVEVTDKITKSADDESNLAVFYLERVVAKVSVSLAQQGSYSTNWGAPTYNYSFPCEVTVDNVARTSMKVSVQGWKLVNLSNSTYLMQHFDDSWKALRSNDPSHQHYRMVGMPNNGGSVVTDEDGEYYRVNFSKRVGFDSQLSTALASYMTAEHSWGCDWQTTSSLYCPENTMEVEHMMVKNATHVLVKVKYDIDGDFYIIDKKKSALYSLSTLKDVLADSYGTTAEKIEVTQTGTSQCTLTVDGVTQDDKRIDVYKEGYAYYLLPISHFGDYYTPWKQNETPSPTPINWSETSTDEPNINRSYPSTNRDDNYLGRWGVVRNNWYKLTITGVSAIGEPQNFSEEHTIITNDNTPLDYYESGLRIQLTVDPWHLRNQQVVIVTP